MADFSGRNDEHGKKRPVLLILPRMHGFFSLVFQAIGQAHVAEKTGQVPLVYFNRHCPYWSDEGYAGARNVWEYFFEPLSTLRIEELFAVPPAELEQATADDFTRLCAGRDIFPTPKYPPVIEYRSPIGVSLERRFVHGLLAKHLVLKPHVEKKRDEFHAAHFGSRPVLGVHYRGIEKASGAIKDWVVSRTPADGQADGVKAFYFREMRRYVRRNPAASIFIATDSQAFLEEAVAEFGRAVFCREATRLAPEKEAVGLHFSEETKTNGPRLGEEVLLDALLLARADYLIHGISNVSNAALFFNPQMGHVDVEVRHGRTQVYLRREIYRQMNRRAPWLSRQVERLENLLRFSK